MADWYRHVSMGLDGVVCQVEAELSSGKMHVRGWRDEQGQNWIAYRSHHADDIRIEDPQGFTTVLGKAMGNFACCWTPDGRLAVQHDDWGYLHLHSRDGRVLTKIHAPYAAEGIWSIDDERGVVMMNDPSRLRVMPNGEQWHNVCETERFVVGQFGRDPDFGGSLSLFDKHTGQVKRWLGYTPHPPFALQVGDEMLVAISGRDTPPIGQVEWVDDFPALPPKVEPTPQPIPPSPPIDTVDPYKAGYAAGLELGRACVSKLETAREALIACQGQLPTEPVFTADEVLRIVNMATGKLPRYWRLIGVEGAVDRAVKAELRIG